MADDKGDLLRGAEPPAWPRQAPAWLVSALFHLAVLIIGVVLFPGGPAPPLEEPLRPVSIAVVSRPAPAVPFSDDRRSLDGPNVSSPEAPPLPTIDDAAPLPEASAALIRPDSGKPNASPGGVPALGASPLDGNPAAILGRPGAGFGDRPRILPGLGDAEILAQEAARAKAKKPAGPQSEVSLFGGESARGNSFVFLLDRSKSMGAEGIGALEVAERELLAQLSRLEEGRFFQILAYNQSIVSMTERSLEPAGGESVAKAQRFLKELVPYAGTEHEAGIMAALRRDSDVVFVFTDGGDPPLVEPQIEAITERNRGRAAIHVIQVGRGTKPEFSEPLREVARRNRGSYRFLDLNAEKKR